jgi:Zn-finger nucleic acid-binding protein
MSLLFNGEPADGKRRRGDEAMATLKSEREMECPCCGATLVVDVNLGRVVAHKDPPSTHGVALDNAQKVLQDQARRREAIFEQSMQTEKGRDDALSRRFEEALEQAKKEPVTKPLRNFDLD